MRRLLIAGNWKLNLGPSAAGALAAGLADIPTDSVDLAVFPSAISVTRVLDALASTAIDVGIQDVHSAPTGAFTGANSARLAREAGCTRALVGHSERRTVFGDTDQDVAAKVQTCLSEGLLPMVCVGETLEERDAGRVEEVVGRQLSVALGELPKDQLASVTIAYEPVWAIGTGRTATPAQAQDVHAFIRSWLASVDTVLATQLRVLYGGSVKPHNAAELMSCPDIDGALVGGASLKLDAFAAIAAAR